MSGCARQRHPIAFQSFQYNSPFSFLDFASFLFTFFSCTLGVQACTTGRRSVFPAFSRVAHRVAAISDVFPSAAVLLLVCIHDCSTLPRGVAVLRDAAGSQEVGHRYLRRWRASFPKSKFNCNTGRLSFCGAAFVLRSTISFETQWQLFCVGLPAAPL